VNSMHSEIISAEKRIVELGIDMPPAPQPLGAYTEAVQSGRLLFVTGTLPILAGKPQYAGTLGKEVDLAGGQKAARLAALNALAAAREYLGSLDRIVRVLKTEVYLVTTDDFVAIQPKIADGASQLLLEVFGDKGLSVRKIMGVSSIPLHVPVMVELLFEVQG
jgi:enamine deaminase RidA (YjgF/YER057c/UK114 family)